MKLLNLVCASLMGAIAMLAISPNVGHAAEYLAIQSSPDVVTIKASPVTVSQFTRLYAINLYPQYETDPQGATLRAQVASGSNVISVATESHRVAFRRALQQWQGRYQFVSAIEEPKPKQADSCSCGADCQCGPDCACRTAVAASKPSTQVVTATTFVRVKHRHHHR